MVLSRASRSSSICAAVLQTSKNGSRLRLWKREFATARFPDPISKSSSTSSKSPRRSPDAPNRAPKSRWAPKKEDDSSYQQAYLDLCADLLSDKELRNAPHTKPGQSIEPLQKWRPISIHKMSFHETEKGYSEESLRTSHATRTDNPTILVVHHAGKSLTEADFRRMTPKNATHLRDWSGPASILKVVPARDVQSLEQSNFYYIFFRNPAQAKIFQMHWRDLHVVAKHYTPTGVDTSVDKPPDQDDQKEHGFGLKKPNLEEGSIPTMPVNQGRMLGFEELDPASISEDLIHKVLRDYTALPPSAVFQAPMNLCKPGSQSEKLYEDLGYPAITRQGWMGHRDWTLRAEDGTIASKGLNDRLFHQDRSNRAVKFHFHGCQKKGLVHALIKADAVARGASWDCQIECRAKIASQFYLEANDEVADSNTHGMTRAKSQDQGGLFWILTFADEDNARRFVRRWHKRCVSLGEHVDDVVADAELLW